MREIINEEVSVISYFSARTKVAAPKLIHWQNKEYEVGKIGYHHSYLEGRERQHIYELVDKNDSLWFRLRLDTSNMHWTLEVVSDGEPS